MLKTLSLVAVIATLSACSHLKNTSNTLVQVDHKAEPIQTLYDYQVMASDQQSAIEFSDLVTQLAAKDVIFIGEHHSHQASHLLQLQLIAALYHQNPNIIISMEQFTRDSQRVIDLYLSGKYGEATLIKEAHAWDHYKGSYRPILEFARIHHIPVVAANAPAMHVRCVGKQGLSVLDKLPQEERVWSAKEIDIDNQAYRAKFFSFMKGAGNSHGQTPEQQQKTMLNTFSAQLLRDTTMAESIANTLSTHKNAQVIHLNGAFHSDGHMGTVAVLNNLMPELDISVLSPLSVEIGKPKIPTAKEFSQGDYLYLIANLPERYIDVDKRKQSINRLIKKRMSEECEIK
ncbi:ChaN family lipoprotein [Thalassotalea piscium]